MSTPPTPDPFSFEGFKASPEQSKREREEQQVKKKPLTPKPPTSGGAIISAFLDGDPKMFLFINTPFEKKRMILGNFDALTKHIQQGSFKAQELKEIFQNRDFGIIDMRSQTIANAKTTSISPQEAPFTLHLPQGRGRNRTERLFAEFNPQHFETEGVPEDVLNAFLDAYALTSAEAALNEVEASLESKLFQTEIFTDNMKEKAKRLKKDELRKKKEKELKNAEKEIEDADDAAARHVKSAWAEAAYSDRKVLQEHEREARDEEIHFRTQQDIRKKTREDLNDKTS